MTTGHVWRVRVLAYVGKRVLADDEPMRCTRCDKEPRLAGLKCPRAQKEEA